MKAIGKAGGRTGGGEKGVAREKGSMVKLKCLKTETLKGRRHRRGPGFGELRRFRREIIGGERNIPSRFAKISFGCGFLGGNPPGGFRKITDY
jgi:hypothetical protein